MSHRAHQQTPFKPRSRPGGARVVSSLRPGPKRNVITPIRRGDVAYVTHKLETRCHICGARYFFAFSFSISLPRDRYFATRSVSYRVLETLQRHVRAMLNFYSVFVDFTRFRWVSYWECDDVPRYFRYLAPAIFDV